MKTAIFSLRSHGPIGPGGWACSCCRPPQSGRKKLSRLWKKAMNRMLDKFEKGAE